MVQLDNVRKRCVFEEIGFDINGETQKENIVLTKNCIIFLDTHNCNKRRSEIMG